jgi:uncharacterized RDD family membrane protein YckC
VSVADRPRHSVRALPNEAAERQGTRAGVVSRVLAMVVDAAYSVAFVGLGYGLWAAARLVRRPREFAWPGVSYVTLVTAALIVAAIMLTVSWAGTGRSPGGRLMGLRVLGPDASPPRLGRSLLRAIACVVFPIGLFWSALSKRNASIQDLVFRTSVAYDWHQRT